MWDQTDFLCMQMSFSFTSLMSATNTCVSSLHCLPDKMCSVASRFSRVHAEGFVPGCSRSGGCRIFDFKETVDDRMRQCYTQKV